MAFSEKAKQLMEDADFQAKLEQAEDLDAYKAVFAAEGLDFDTEFGDAEDTETDVELSAEDLDNVAGGLSTDDLVRAVKSAYRVVKDGAFKGTFKFASSCGVLLRAYYDIKVHNNVYRSYSKSQIEAAARYIGCI